MNDDVAPGGLGALSCFVGNGDLLLDQRLVPTRGYLLVRPVQPALDLTSLDLDRDGELLRAHLHGGRTPGMEPAAGRWVHEVGRRARDVVQPGRRQRDRGERKSGV